MFYLRLFTSATQAFSSALLWIVLTTSSMCWRLSTGCQMLTPHVLHQCCSVECFFLSSSSSTFYRYVEVLDKYFGSVCELDIIFNFEKAYFILDELILGGEMQVTEWQNMEYRFTCSTWLQETSKKAVLSQIEQADKFQEVRRPPLCSSERSRASCIVYTVYFSSILYAFFSGGDCRVGTEGHWIDLNFTKGKTLANCWPLNQYFLSSPFQIVGSHSMWWNKFSWEISQCDSISSYVYCDHPCIMIWTLFSWHTIQGCIFSIISI